jgi:F-type H+-transporting ATPase subunit delta
MAGEQQIARRYAQAYFGLARQAKDIPAWREGLQRVTETLVHPEVSAALRDPRLSHAERIKLVADLLRDAPKPAYNLVRLLVERGRTAVLPLVLEQYDALADRASGVLRAEVVTAVPVSPALEATIARTLSEKLGGEVHTEVRQDPAILGGLVIRIGDRVIDGSVRTKLDQLQAALV